MLLLAVAMERFSGWSASSGFPESTGRKALARGDKLDVGVLPENPGGVEGFPGASVLVGDPVPGKGVFFGDGDL